MNIGEISRRKSSKNVQPRNANAGGMPENLTSFALLDATGFSLLRFSEIPS
jgi:hypothetical protein